MTIANSTMTNANDNDNNNTKNRVLQKQQGRHYVGAGIILVRLDGEAARFLLLRGRDTGIWSFSKGHPEETDHARPLRTAVRETYEETGLMNGRDYAIVGNSVRFGKRPYWLGVVMPDSLDRVRVAHAEHNMAAWLTHSEIEDLKMSTNTDVRVWSTKAARPNSTFAQTLKFVQGLVSVP